MALGHLPFLRVAYGCWLAEAYISCYDALKLALSSLMENDR